MKRERPRRWVVYFAGEFATSRSYGPCRVLYRRGDYVRVELDGSGRRMWVFPYRVHTTSGAAAEAAAPRLI